MLDKDYATHGHSEDWLDDVLFHLVGFEQDNFENKKKLISMIRERNVFCVADLVMSRIESAERLSGERLEETKSYFESRRSGRIDWLETRSDLNNQLYFARRVLSYFVPQIIIDRSCFLFGSEISEMISMYLSKTAEDRRIIEAAFSE